MTLFFRVEVLLLVIFFTLAWCSPAAAAKAPKTAQPSKDAWMGVVTYVMDGDTIRVRPPEGGKPLQLRIHGIEAPEICQPGGMAARSALKRRILGERVAVYGKVRDHDGHLVGRVVFNHQDQGRGMVANGLAWSYRRHDGDAGPYAAQQRSARAARLGLFSRTHGAEPVYPAVFRKQHGRCYK